MIGLLVSCKAHVSSPPEFSDISQKNQIEIKKVNNFRFLGGLQNSQGKILKDSLIYRSGNLHQLKSNSFDDFERLKIAKVIDLRTNQETAKAPDHLPVDVIYKNYPAFEDKSDEMDAVRKLVLRGKVNKEDADQRMLEFYSKYLSENPEAVKIIIREVLDSGQPILYHCTAGKDRTGMITALILKILKFDNDVIFEEYLISNDLRKNMINRRIRLANNLHFVYPRLDIGVLEKTGWIERNYLQTAFDEIDHKYGSVDNYIHKVLEISESEREIYINKFLK